MPEISQPHVFISYVHEDAERVDELCRVLEAVDIPYWRDHNQLAPGDEWKRQIRKAIQEGSLVFLACFSASSVAKGRTYMNDEIGIAIDEFRKMPPGRTWFIPARLDDVEVPDWPIGAGRTLNELHHIDLFGAAYTKSAVLLVERVQELLGNRSSASEQVEAALDETNAAHRAETLERRTKDWLLDSSKSIQLEDLVLAEANRLREYLNSRELLKTVAEDPDGDADAVEIMRRMKSIWDETEPLARSLVVASRWATPDNIGPWVSAVRSVAGAAHEDLSGDGVLLPLRKIAVTAAITAVALSAVEAGKWENLKDLVVEPQIQDRYDGTRSVLNSTSFAEPYQYLNKALASSVTRSYTEETSLEELWREFSQMRGGQLFTPLADWMRTVFKPIVSDRLSSSQQYDEAFDKAEVVLGALSWDLYREENSGRSGRSLWYGGSTWRRNQSPHRPSAAQRLQEELERAGATWPPLRAGLFGGDLARARDAVNGYASNFEEIARSRF